MGGIQAKEDAPDAPQELKRRCRAVGARVRVLAVPSAGQCRVRS